MSNKYTEEQEKEIIRLYTEEGKNQKEIAEIFNTYNTTIRRILLRNNIDIIGKSERHRVISLEDIKSKEGTDAFDYFIGVLLTDGCNTKGAIILEFAENNKEILDYWNEFLGNKCNINVSYHHVYKTPQYRLAFRSKEVIPYLESFGIVENKSLIVKAPYINWSLLRGAFDGDGCVTRETNSKRLRVTFTSGSLVFLEQIKEFLNENSIDCTIRKTETNHASTEYYVLYIHKQEHIKRFYNNLYLNATYFLKRKYEKFGSLSEKSESEYSVNSGKENCNSNPEPSYSDTIEGAETRHGEPKVSLDTMVKV